MSSIIDGRASKSAIFIGQPSLSASMVHEQSLQDRILEMVVATRVPVAIFLVNGIKLQGEVVSFDKFVVLLHGGTSHQLVYKHSISTIVPARPLAFSHADK